MVASSSRTGHLFRQKSFAALLEYQDPMFD